MKTQWFQQDEAIPIQLKKQENLLAVFFFSDCMSQFSDQQVLTILMGFNKSIASIYCHLSGYMLHAGLLITDTTLY